jgi:hypothetical protein
MESAENLVVDVSSKPEVDIPVAVVKSLEVDESLHDDVSLADATDDVINVDDGVLPDVMNHLLFRIQQCPIWSNHLLLHYQ